MVRRDLSPRFLCVLCVSAVNPKVKALNLVARLLPDYRQAKIMTWMMSITRLGPMAKAIQPKTLMVRMTFGITDFGEIAGRV